jgi:hypothetical protein
MQERHNISILKVFDFSIIFSLLTFFNSFQFSKPEVKHSFLNINITKPNQFFTVYFVILIDLYINVINIIIANKIKNPDMLVNTCKKEAPLLLK